MRASHIPTTINVNGRALAGADPLEVRLKHLKDPRAIAVLEGLRTISGWEPRPAPRGLNQRGRGVIFVHYNNGGGYVGMVVNVSINAGSGKVRVDEVFCSHDCGLIVNPDVRRNQIEGDIIQTLARAGGGGDLRPAAGEVGGLGGLPDPSLLGQARADRDPVDQPSRPALAWCGRAGLRASDGGGGERNLRCQRRTPAQRSLHTRARESSAAP